MVWLPTDRELIELLFALPPESVTGVPKFEPSILNWTVPEGVPLPGAIALTVAVKVTACPYAEGLIEEERAVAEFALFTVWAMLPLLVLRLLLPP